MIHLISVGPLRRPVRPTRGCLATRSLVTTFLLGLMLAGHSAHLGDLFRVAPSEAHAQTQTQAQAIDGMHLVDRIGGGAFAISWRRGHMIGITTHTKTNQLSVNGCTTCDSRVVVF